MRFGSFVLSLRSYCVRVTMLELFGVVIRELFMDRLMILLVLGSFVLELLDAHLVDPAPYRGGPFGTLLFCLLPIDYAC